MIKNHALCAALNMTRRAPRFFMPALAGALLLALAACSNNDKDEPKPEPDPAPGYESVITYGGSTTITCLDDTSVPMVTNTAMTYELTFDTDARKVTIMCHNANFGNGMPVSLDIEMRDVSLMTLDEQYTFSSSSLIPYLGGAPYRNVPITNLYGLGRVGSDAGLSISFDCDVQTFTGHTFKVSAENLTPVE